MDGCILADAADVQVQPSPRCRPFDPDWSRWSRFYDGRASQGASPFLKTSCCASGPRTLHFQRMIRVALQPGQQQSSRSKYKRACATLLGCQPAQRLRAIGWCHGRWFRNERSTRNPPQPPSIWRDEEKAASKRTAATKHGTVQGQDRRPLSKPEKTPARTQFPSTRLPRWTVNTGLV